MNYQDLMDERVDPQSELVNLLHYNGIKFQQESDGVRFVFADAGYKWETVCRYCGQRVLMYGIYPFFVAHEQQALVKLNDINARLVMGGMFLQDSNIVMRTCADVWDAYTAYETIARALEYNAAAVVTFWKTLVVCT